MIAYESHQFLSVNTEIFGVGCELACLAFPELDWELKQTMWALPVLLLLMFKGI